MLLGKLKIASALLLMSLAVAGAVLMARPTPAEPPAPPLRGAERPDAEARTDRHGDPLPAGALARLGTVRLRHSNWVTSVAFSPDGNHLVSASWDHTIRLWDRATGKELRRFTGHTHAVMGVAFSADGKSLASAGGDGTARVWDVATGKELFQVQAHGRSTVNSVAFSPDGKTLASGGGGNGDRTLVLWDAASGKELRVLGDVRGSITTAAFSPDGKVLAAGGGDRTVDLWDVATGERLRRLKGHDRGVSSLAFSPDGKKLITGSHDDTVRVWDAATGREVLQLAGQGGVSRNPDGVGHDGGVHSVAVSADGKLLASGGYNGTVRLWDAAAGKELVKLEALGREVKALAFAPDGKALATAGYDHVIHLWDPVTGKRLLPSGGHDATAHFVTVAPDGRRVASVSNDQSVRLWDARTGEELRVLRGHKDYVACAAFSPDGRTLASGDWRGVIRLWDVATGKEVHELVGHEGYVMSLAFSPDGKLLASGSWGSGGGESSVRLWDPAVGKEVRKLMEAKDPDVPVSVVSFLPDGKTLAAQDTHATVILDVATGKEVRRFDGRFGFAVSPDGLTFAAGDSENRVGVWEAATGKQLARFGKLESALTRFAFSADGRSLTWASVSESDKTVRLWEVATGKARAEFEGHQGAVIGVALSADGKILVSASEDTTLLVWDVTHTNWNPGPKGVEGWWTDLADEDAVKAYAAVCGLAREPKQAVPFLKERLRPAKAADPKQVAQLIADLDSDRFEVRQRATKALEQLGELAGPALTKAMESNPSPEARARLEALIGRLERRVLSPEELRALRAVEALERAGVGEVREVLDVLAGGVPEARLTREAKAALGRLTRRPAAMP